MDSPREFQLTWRGYFVYQWRKLTRPNIVSLDGVKLHVSADLPRGIRRALYRGDYEFSERRLVQEVLERSDRVLEVGSGIGLVSLNCIRICGEEAVVCYEANPRFASAIRRNFSLNNVSADIRNRALAERAGETEFFFQDKALSSSLVKRTDESRATKVPCDGIGDVVAAFRPTAIVMDVEGAEVDLLPAADLSGVRKLLIEIHAGVVGKDRIDGLLDFLAAEGFIHEKDLDVRDVIYLARL